jgi:hypothetical protein
MAGEPVKKRISVTFAKILFGASSFGQAEKGAKKGEPS